MCVTNSLTLADTVLVTTLGQIPAAVIGVNALPNTNITESLSADTSFFTRPHTRIAAALSIAVRVIAAPSDGSLWKISRSHLTAAPYTIAGRIL